MPIGYLPIQHVTFRAERTAIDIENRTVTLIASDESPVDRFSFERWEPYELVLSHDQAHVDLNRVKNGVAMFFDGHPGGLFSSSTRIGKIIEAGVSDKKQLICKVKLNRTPEADQYLQDCEDGTEPGNSVGINVKKLELISKAKYEPHQENEDSRYSRKKIKQPAKYKAVFWELQELSVVDIPANPSARKLSKEDQEKFNALPKYPVEILTSDDESFSYFSSNINLDYLDKTKKNSEKTPVSEKENTNQSQLADENRDLKLRLSQAEKNLAESKVTLDKTLLENNYFRLRIEAIKLWAVDNKLTKEEYELDFSEDSKIDIDRLTAMSGEDAKIELKTIERSLRRSSLKSPIERLNESDRALLSNSDIKSKSVDDLKKSEKMESDDSEKTQQELDAEKFLETYKVKRI